MPVQSIDISQLDLIVGVVMGAAAVFILGFILYRIGLVRFSIEKDHPKDDSRNPALLVLLQTLEGHITGLRGDLKQYADEHRACQVALPEKYVQWEIYNRLSSKLDEDRKEKWERFFEHTHDPTSGVVVRRK